MYLRSDWFIQELRYLKFQVHIKMVKYTFKWGGVKHKKSLVGIGLKYLSKMSAILQETVMPLMIEKKKKQNMKLTLIYAYCG